MSLLYIYSSLSFCVHAIPSHFTSICPSILNTLAIRIIWNAKKQLEYDENTWPLNDYI